MRGVRLRARALLVLASAAVVCGAGASAASASGRLYWVATTATGTEGAIRVANLDGLGSASNLFAAANPPGGVALDPAANKIFWSDGAIEAANLDGTGSPSRLFTEENTPVGDAINPATNKIYWADYGSGAIRVANIDGSGSPETLFTGEDDPQGIALDPAANKIYWTDGNSDLIRVANLDGTGSPKTLFTDAGQPYGIAINPAANKIYWTDLSGAIRVANLDGTGSPANLFTGENVPVGLALDSAANKIYWSAGNSIRVANLDGTGSPANLLTGENNPNWMALLLAPAGTGIPAITRDGTVGQQLACSDGSWAADLPGASLYQAPRSFADQWRRNGIRIGGANQARYTPTAAGTYTCRVTASNQAGSSTQTSAAVNVALPRTPIVAGAAESHASWALGNKLATEAKHKPPIGTTFSFTLNEPARVDFAFTQRELGRKVRGKCVAQAKHNHPTPSCKRTVTQATLRFTAHAGRNKLSFQGRISASKKLQLGRYTLLINATNTAGRRSKPASLSFTIVK